MKSTPSRLSQILSVCLLFPAIMPLHAQEGGSLVGSRISLFEAEFLSEYEQGVERVFKANERELDLKYYQALDRILDQAVKTAKLDEAIAIREEKKRIDEATGVPTTDGPTDPAPLKQVRATYRIERQKLEAARELATGPVLANHDSRLEGYQTLLTTEGKLDDALKVKQARANAAAVLQAHKGIKVEPPMAKAAPAPAAAAPPVTDDGWHEIFNGVDLTSWKPMRTPRSFPVKDGILSARRESRDADYLFFDGDLVVPKQLKNFEMLLTLKGDAEVNSGIWFHLVGRAENRRGFLETGLEINLAKGRFVKYPTGSLYVAGGQGRREPPVNQADWFDLRFRVKGQKVTVWINDRLYYEQTAPLAGSSKTRGLQPDGGRLAIQANSEEGAFHFKRIAIKVLE